MMDMLSDALMCFKIASLFLLAAVAAALCVAFLLVMTLGGPALIAFAIYKGMEFLK